MNRILAKILFPGLFLFVVSSILFIVSLRSRKLSQKKKRADMLFFAVLAIAGLAFSAYNSVDLIKKDFVTESGTYIDDYRDGERHKLVFEASDGTQFHCYVLFGELDEISLSHSEDYTVTFAKRTQMLISVE